MRLAQAAEVPGRRGRWRLRPLAGTAGVEWAGWRLGARRATHSETPARLSFTLVPFISCSCPRIDKGAIGRRNPGIRSSWYMVTSLKVPYPIPKMLY